ncbi:MAG: Xaa-Pro peptidase family protein [Candidatus Thorarchaeota archaeon]|nr:Xaa-Pro peptidase family protein [Candidatus Thorarchaeota archaeon]
MEFTPQKLEKVHRAMQREEVDVLLITRAQDVQYITGYQTQKYYLPTACIVVNGKTPLLLISNLQKEALGQDSVMSEVRDFTPHRTDTWYPTHADSFWSHIKETIHETGMQSGMFGLQQEWLSVRDFEGLKSSLPDAGFKDFSSVLWRLRQVKDAAEIDAITQAVRVAEIGIRTALELVTPEKTESLASVEIESAMRSAGGQLRGIRAAILSGSNARFPFAQPGPHRISSSVPVVIDITVSHAGYFAEVARTVHLGTPTKEQRALFEDNLNISKTIEANVAPGITIDELVSRVSSEIGKQCPQEVVIGPLGSSVGLDLREPPPIMAGNMTALRAGMVLSVHPVCYDPNIGSTKIADILHVTEDGCDNLTTLARETM